MALPRPPDGQAMPDLRALQVELAELMSSVRKFQDQLRLATIAADERTRELQTKVEELEAQNLSQAFDIRGLEEENAKMLQDIETGRPELARVTRERNDMAKELQNARRVIEDLLRHQQLEGSTNTLTTLQTVHTTNVPDANGRPVGHSPLNQNHHPPTSEAYGRGHGAESDDESTVRSPRSIASRGGTPANLPRNRTSDSAIGGPTSQPSQQSDVSVSVASTSSSRKLVSRASSLDTDISVSTDMPSSSGKASASKNRLSWYLEFAKPPATAETSQGPYPFDLLANKLVLGDDAFEQIATLEFESGYNTRIYPEADVVFVYQPIILEAPSDTYLIGWCESVNELRNVERWVKDSEELNVFCFPMIQDAGWYYLGIQSLSYAPLESVWGKLTKEDKENLLIELRKRNPDMDVSKFRKDVRTGKLRQCCIQLESRGKKAESLDFLRTYELCGDGRVG
ncbi:hypothetical protein C8Q80DRAFT_1157771 [Daedaleopsis nitida]|nr:hypothetical protein C8Q80DRAFT_1157771 [Daedaleopsis nitida]